MHTAAPPIAGLCSQRYEHNPQLHCRMFAEHIARTQVLTASGGQAKVTFFLKAMPEALRSMTQAAQGWEHGHRTGLISTVRLTDAPICSSSTLTVALPLQSPQHEHPNPSPGAQHPGFY